MSLSEKLRELRHQSKLTATYVSSQLGIAKSTLSNYESGSRTPKAEMLGKFAAFYNTTMDYLFGLDAKSNSQTCGVNRFNGVSIAIFGSITDTDGVGPDENIIGYTDLGSEYIGKGDFFAFYIADDSLSNMRICEGDIAIVRRQDCVENGEVAVALPEGEYATVKKIFTTDDAVTLMPASLNPSYQSRIIDKRTTKIFILGKVVEVKIKV